MGLSFETWGDGAGPLLLLHGFTGNKNSWDAFRPFWSHAFRVVAVDLPGHGRSPLPSTLGEAGFRECLVALKALLSQLGIARTDVLGYSQGARMALAFALDAPESVRRLMLESAHPGLEDAAARAERASQDEDLARFIELAGLEAFCRRWEALPLFEGIRRLSPTVQSTLKARRLTATSTGLAGALRCLGLASQPNLWPRLSSLGAPTLLLTGAEDEKFTQLARRMSKLIPMARWHQFPGCGHAPHLETTQAYAQVVRSFLVEAHEKVPKENAS